MAEHKEHIKWNLHVPTGYDYTSRSAPYLLHVVQITNIHYCMWYHSVRSFSMLMFISSTCIQTHCEGFLLSSASIMSKNHLQRCSKNINEHCFRVATFAKVELLACYSHSKNRKQRLKTFSTSPWEAYSWDLMGGKYASHGKIDENWVHRFSSFASPLFYSRNLRWILAFSSSRQVRAENALKVEEENAKIQQIFASLRSPPQPFVHFLRQRHGRLRSIRKTSSSLWRRLKTPSFLRALRHRPGDTGQGSEVTHSSHKHAPNLTQDLAPSPGLQKTRHQGCRSLCKKAMFRTKEKEIASVGVYTQPPSPH